MDSNEQERICRKCGNPERLHGPKPDGAVDDGFGGETWYHWHPFEPVDSNEQVAPELLPCPCCSGEAEKRGRFDVKCSGCGLEINSLSPEKDWNTRPAALAKQGSPPADTVERAREDVVQSFKDWTFNYCGHQDRDRNYDYCSGCAATFMRLLSAALLEKDAEIERLKSEIALTDERIIERAAELMNEVEAARTSEKSK